VLAKVGPIDYFFSFKGRLARLDYWKVLVGGLLIAMGLNLANFLFAMFIIGNASESLDKMTFWPMMMIDAGFYLSVVSACVRRLHDVGRSGWWTPLVLVFFFLGILFIGCVPGDRGAKNRFGPDPLQSY
jgi:uncharacterized membrane protein YhaH (DUF805 family)